MICPYNRKEQTTVLQWVQNNEDESSNCQQVENVKFSMMECPEEGCPSGMMVGVTTQL